MSMQIENMTNYELAIRERNEARAELAKVKAELNGALFAANQHLQTVETQARIIAGQAAQAPIQSGELAELRKRAEAATPGPWYASDWTMDDGPSAFTVEARAPEVLGTGQSSIWPDGIRKYRVAEAELGENPLADAAYIAAANPAMIVRLLDALASPAAQQQASTGSIRDHADFREDLERLSEPGLAKKQAKVIRKAIYDTIDARVRNLGAAQEQAAIVPMSEQFANILRIQKEEAANGDAYMVGLYNGMAMMCANIDNTDFEPMNCAAPVPPQAHALTDAEILEIWHSLEGKTMILGANQLNWSEGLCKAFARAIAAHLARKG